MKLQSMRFSFETDVKVHFSRVNEGDLKWSLKEIKLILEKLTVDKNKQVVKKSTTECSDM